MDQDQMFVSLSNKEFNKDEAYDYWNSKDQPNHFVGMWFAPATSGEFISPWHKQLSKANSKCYVTHCCNEDGETHVIYAKLKNALIVSPEEIQDEITAVLNEYGADVPAEITRKKLLDLVKKKFGRENIEYLMCNVDGPNEKTGGLTYIEPFMMSDGEKKRAEDYAEQDCIQDDIRDKIAKLFYIATGKHFFKDYKKDVMIEVVDFLKRIWAVQEFSDEEYLKIFEQYYKLASETEMDENVNEVTYTYDIKNNTTISFKYNGDIDGILNDESAGRQIKIDVIKDVVSKYGPRYRDKNDRYKKYIDIYSHEIIGCNTLKEFEELDQSLPIKAPEKIYNKFLRLFSGMVNEKYLGEFDIPSLCVIDLNAIVVEKQEKKELFTKEDIIKGILNELRKIDIITGKRRTYTEEKMSTFNRTLQNLGYEGGR